MKRLALALSLIASTGVAVAQKKSAPAKTQSAASSVTYLSCTRLDKDGAVSSRISFTLNEAAGTVSYPGSANSNALNVETAIFSPDTVVFGSPGEVVSIRRTIDRNTLAYKEVMSVAGVDKEVTGACKVLAPPAGRKF